MIVRIAVNLLLLGAAPPGGTGRYAICLFEALVALSHRYPDRIAVRAVCVEEARRHLSPAANALVDVVSSGGGGGVHRVWNELVALPRRMRANAAEILINPSFYGAVTGTPRRAVVIHDLYFRKAPETVPPRRRWLLRVLVPLVARRSERVLTVSQTTNDAFTRYYSDLASRTAVIYSATPHTIVEGMAVPPPIPWPYVMMVGHLTANKRADIAVAAVRRLRDEGLAIGLVHVGEDLGRLTSFSTDDGVLPLGMLADPVLSSIYRGSIAALIPSTDEGFGLPMLEAQALGVPVVASTGGALPEVGGAGALYFHVDDITACAAAIRRLATDQAFREELIDMGRSNVRRFSWERTARAALAALSIELPVDDVARGNSAK